MSIASARSVRWFPLVFATARALADFSVVDCGFCLETDEELSFDTVAPRRNGATLAVLDDADLIVVVGSAIRSPPHLGSTTTLTSPRSILR